MSTTDDQDNALALDMDRQRLLIDGTHVDLRRDRTGRRYPGREDRGARTTTGSMPG